MIEFVSLRTPESLSRIRTISDDIWPKTFRDILSQEQIRYMMKMMYAPEVMEKELAEGYSFDLLLVDGKDAGYMVYAPYDEPGTMKLHKLYLLEEYHGKGYGQRMISHVMEEALARGFTSIILAVNKRNLRAKKAYDRAGFTVEKAVRIDIGNGFFMDDYWMRCPCRKNPADV